MEYRECNAKIVEADLFSQNIPGHEKWLAIRMRFDTGGKYLASFNNVPVSGNLISEILYALELESWSRLVGTYVRIRYDATVRQVGHIIHNQWVEVLR